MDRLNCLCILLIWGMVEFSDTVAVGHGLFRGKNGNLNLVLYTAGVNVRYNNPNRLLPK